ncbi:MAG: GNAT family N-acetyltransferase [Hyphomicrobiaceae bacterium]|nr:GNAT family N-acetyltransferase [Hyphomicrobiaceae bacterium]
MQGFDARVSVRDAEVADAAALAEIYVCSWRQAYRGIVPYVQLERALRRRGIDWWRREIRRRDQLIVLDVADVAVGYAMFGTARDRGPEQGEIYEIYLDPVHQGLGLGELLFEAARYRLDGLGLRGLVVWVLAGNDIACDFYHRRGGKLSRSVVDRSTGARLEKVSYTWT